MSEHKIGMKCLNVMEAFLQQRHDADGSIDEVTSEEVAEIIERETGINKTISMLVSCHFALGQIETRDAFDDNRRLRKMNEIKTLLAEYGETV